jgi:hypothetical protein
LNDLSLLGQLEALAHRLNIPVRYECLEGETALHSGGLCRIGKKHIIIVNAKATVKDKIKTLAEALRRFDLESIYVKPALRDFLESRYEENESTTS